MKTNQRRRSEGKIAIASPLWSFKDIFEPVKTYINKLESEWCKWYTTLKTPITPARNNLLKQIYNDWFERILNCDDDNPPIRQDALDIMLDIDKDIVTWWVRKKTDPKVLCLKEKKEKEIGWEYVSYDKPFTWKVDLAWTWFMLINRKVIEAMLNKYPMPFERSFVKYIKTDKWFEELWYATWNPEITKEWKVIIFQRELSSDYLFCERCIWLWFEVWTDKRLKCDHYIRDNEWNIEITSV